MIDARIANNMNGVKTHKNGSRVVACDLTIRCTLEVRLMANELMPAVIELPELELAALLLKHAVIGKQEVG